MQCHAGPPQVANLNKMDAIQSILELVDRGGFFGIPKAFLFSGGSNRYLNFACVACTLVIFHQIGYH